MALTPTRRNLLAMTAVLSATAIGLAGCGSSNTGTDTPKEATTQSATADTEEKSGEALEIAYMHRLPDGDGMTKVN